MLPRRSRASALSIAMGSSERFPDVMTSGSRDLVQEQAMQRRVGQHDAHLDQVAGDRWSDGRVAWSAPSPQQHDRTHDACEQRLLLGVDLAYRTGDLEILDHDGQGFAPAVLPLAQQRHGIFVRGVAGEMEPTESFDREDPSLQQHLRGCREYLVAPCPLGLTVPVGPWHDLGRSDPTAHPAAGSGGAPRVPQQGKAQPERAAHALAAPRAPCEDCLSGRPLHLPPARRR